MKKPSRKLFKQFDPEGTEDLEEWRRIFVELEDLSEYEPAMELTGSWQEWERFKKEWPHFRNVILPSWMAELEVRMRSKSIRSLVREAEKGDVGAAKFITEGKYKPRRIGKPTKAEIEREVKIAAGIEDEVQDDIERVSSVVTFTGKK